MWLDDGPLDRMTITLALGALVIVLLIGFLMRRSPSSDIGSWTREEMLRRSYVAGEIDRRTYRRIRRGLRR